MSNDIRTLYPGRINPADADYPFGSIRNESIPGANDGTPLTAEWGNDFEALKQGALKEAGATPSGTTDTAESSQILNALKDNTATVAGIATGRYPAGRRLAVTERAGGVFVIQVGGTPNGMDILSAGGLNTAVLQFDDEINVDWLGASGDNSPTDAPYLQRALDMAQSVSTQPIPVYAGNSAMRSLPAVSLSPTKQYNVGATPVVLPQFAIIKGNRATLSCDTGGKVFDSTVSYRLYCEDVTFHGDDVQAVVLDIPNLDNAKYYFRKCWFSTHTRTVGKFACDISSQSSIVVFDECDGISASNFLKCTSDFLYINGGWYNGWDSLNALGTKTANTAWLENRSKKLWMRNVVLIPETDGSGTRQNVRWIDNYTGALVFDSCHFGGENSGFPVVYQYVSPVSDAAPFQNNADILFIGGQASGGANHAGGGGLVTLMPGVLPGRFSFENLVFVNTPLVSAMGYDFNATPAANNAALATALAAASNRTKLKQIGLKINAVTLTLSQYPFPPALKTYLTGDSMVEFGDRYEGTYISPPKDVSHPFMEVVSIEPSAGGQYGSSVYDLVFILTGDPTGGGAQLWQEKRYKLKISRNSGVAPYVSVTQVSIDTTNPSGATSTDVYIGVNVISSSLTNTVFGFTLSSISTLDNAAVSWRLTEQLRAQNGLDVGSALVRNYS